MAGGIAEPGIVSGTRWQARVQRGSATAGLRRMHATASSGDEEAHDVVEAEGGRVVASQDRDAATELGLRRRADAGGLGRRNHSRWHGTQRPVRTSHRRGHDRFGCQTRRTFSNGLPLASSSTNLSR